MDLNDAKVIELSDKTLFDNYFTKFTPEISEFTFTNLFIWRKYYEFLFKEFDDHLIIFSKNYLKNWKKPLSNKKDVICFFPPVGQNPGEIILSLFTNLKNIEIHRVPESIINKDKFDERLKDLNLEFKDDRNNWDYVYNKQELIDLLGNKFRQKRRWLNKFMAQYNHEFNIITAECIQRARKLHLEWCDQNECQSNEDLREEQKAVNEAFDNYFDLELKGGIICVDDKCVGYTLGEMLNNDTIVIHIEKAHVEYEGSYQAINTFFLKNCFEDGLFVNREQDLGLPGLRKAKESYKPHHMVKKFIIYPKSV
jgi:hypothetical protein